MLFQSIGKSVPALILSCLQSGLLFIPLCLTLPRFFGITGIEIAQPIAYFLTSLVSLPMALSFLKRLPKDE
jgi:Na+-driven multidrug efflux pump